MREQIKIHTVLRHDQPLRDQWHLVRDENGRRYVLFETLDANLCSDQPNPCFKRRISVQTILAQNNELSRKLRDILGT